MKVIANFFSRFMAIIVLVVAALALFVPATGMWIQLKAVNYLLMVVMFGMGLTMKLSDFKVVFVHPKEVIVGCVAQFTIMPLLAFALGKVFGLETGLLAGVILVGTCPGGTSSNVITYMSRGNVALSVGMTSVNTLLSPLLTPAITYLLLRTSVNVDVWAMCLSIIQVVIIPIALGFVVNRFAGRYVARALDLLPVVSVIAICLIVSTVVAHNSAKIMTTGAIVFVVVILHNLMGYGCGFAVGKIFKMDLAKTKALTVEIGMQNSGLATSLANASFPNLAMATVSGAIFSVWHNISGAILANILRSRE
ncbi:bile acid:sodium symporter family protein [Fibrobacter sp. UWEL]|uniref:bile acid:sodium symporter family protein n=1 Tax=Fibrobacter sp. UWEL TaxID=1896209 RepID=UPI000918965A|nr:bile acid:sodium symporter family protein [Fibrobacter sp. UWEL]SHL23488.1 bile acid:Na+ symporter, BASS family [Fibrobacter sp. UWEL]